MITATSIVGVFIFFVSLTLIVMCTQKKGYPPLISWTLLAVGLVYGLGWVAVVHSAVSRGNFLGAENIVFNQDYWLLYNLSVMFAVSGIFTGWNILRPVTSFTSKISASIFCLSYRQLMFVAWFMLITAFVFRYLYVSAFGGFLLYLEYSRAIRSGIFEVNNPWSFLQPFGHLALFSSYIFWAVRREGCKTFFNFAGFWLAFLFSVYVLYSWSGRVGFIVYLCVFLLAFIYLKRFPARVIVIGGMVGGLAALYLAYIISNVFEIKGADNFSFYVVREISFPFVSFFAQLEHGEYLYRGFMDLLFSPLYLLPSSWTTGFLEGVEQVNTLVISGAKKGDYGVTGGIPVDLITLGLMQMHIPGIFFTSVVFGVFIKLLQVFFGTVKSDSLRCILLAYAAIKISFISVFYADPSNFIAAIFPILLLILSVLFCKSLVLILR
ncbi:hypothetical protein SAMN05216339_104202 [Nitrosomonas eutropha]|uniref:Oligosaccharide repeat unit polymerase n=1 Tax=Nitrosomonas eutropha TaxID=916 RepID=A0A1I7HBC6_9PROT|nr:hypothetical protein SAMN05216339_104202 [Nitrosomonas eutropha]